MLGEGILMEITEKGYIFQNSKDDINTINGRHKLESCVYEWAKGLLLADIQISDFGNKIYGIDYHKFNKLHFDLGDVDFLNFYVSTPLEIMEFNEIWK